MEKNTAIGSIWFKLWELEEALKSRKALVPSSNLADTEVMDLILPQVTSFAGNFNPSTGIDAVFELEPSGKIGLVLNFGI